MSPSSLDQVGSKTQIQENPRPTIMDEWFSSLFAPQWSRHQEYLARSDKSVRDLELIRDLGPIPDGVTPLITTLHNEISRLPDFLRHYRGLGVKRFIVVDHRSSDGTSEFLSEQIDVHLYRAHGQFDRTLGGQMWVTGLARQFAQGRWALHVDGDELLVYDGMEKHGLTDLIHWLETRGNTRLYAPMLDMYSRGAIAEAVLEHGQRLIDVAPYFDPFQHDNFTFYERVQLPDRIAMFSYGRGRVFGHSLINSNSGQPIRYHMEKFPLSKWHKDTAYCCVHSPFPFCENPQQQLGTLLHFRFAGNFVEYNRSVGMLGEQWDGGASYLTYAKKIAENQSLSLYHHGSRLYKGPGTLIAEGFLKPIEWSSLNSRSSPEM